ncbi:uroporphyrinogen decarboxylase [Dissulfurispira thermophila]|uniref:Uroporphyrinogen decarboxylase n=1 Tax=Dissulfurispira thermophila TaxID=2715679 RepID=A0A7G1H0N8_9BACT|nr:uroporphyrinogen decarboxylase [Dissulfurispira thermophila]BCB96360.1 uroporphyrinogen decarboxylase [Dissulfurispira thermophila]
MNDTFLKACRGEKTEYTPVWLMRQAGRYLPEYQKVRSNVDFLTLCKTPELAAEVTKQPVDILKVDAAILFSDILIPIEPMGMKLEFSESKGPILYDPIRSDIAVSKLRRIKANDDVPFVIETIKILVKDLNVPLIGFSGAPFTLATYMIEGGSSKNYVNTKKMMYQSPELYTSLMEKITDTVINYLQAQIDAGVHAIQVFDSWAGILCPIDFEKYALPYVQRIVLAFKGKVPIIYFAFNSSAMLKLVKQSGADVLGIDWRVDISDAVNAVGNDVAVQGNLDPCTLFGTKDLIRDRVTGILQGAKNAKGHIFNLGHGILPETPVENAIAMVEAVHELSNGRLAYA